MITRHTRERLPACLLCALSCPADCRATERTCAASPIDESHSDRRCCCPSLQLLAHHLRIVHSFGFCTLSDYLHAHALQNIDCIAGTCCAAMDALTHDTCTTGSIQPATQDFSSVVSGNVMIICHVSAMAASPYCMNVHLAVGRYTCIMHCWMIHSKWHLHCSML